MTTPSSRRIVMTTDAVGGVWVYASGLARMLCARGDRITLTVMGPAPDPEQVTALRAVAGLEVVVTDLALEWMDPEGADRRRAREVLLRLADRSAADIVHLDSYREAAFDWPAPVVVVAHSCVLSWWQACRGGRPDEPRWAVYADAVGCGLGRAAAWVAPTRAFRDTIAALYAPRHGGRVIHNGIDVSSAAVRKEKIILAAGRVWDEAKRLRPLVEMSDRLDWPLRIAGDPRGPASASRHADSHCLLGRLTHDELAVAMRRAAIFVAPAVYEPFGLSILEAAGAGCALVLADIPTLRELWDGAALFVEPDDFAATASALQGLCRDEGLRSSMGRRAARRARVYSLGAIADRYGELYDELMAARSVAPRTTLEVMA